MKKFLRFLGLASAVWAVVGLPAQAQETPPQASALDAQLFYQLLLGEINARGGEPGAGYSLMLDAARRTQDPRLYQRAVEIALQARSGDAALQAARAWKQAAPNSVEANRYVLQILVALNRLGEVAEPLKTEITLAEPGNRAITIAALPRLFARASDKKLAASVIEQALADTLKNPATAASAWAAIGRARLAAADIPGALQAARAGQAAEPAASGPVLLALELAETPNADAEGLVRQYLDAPGAKPSPEVRLGYAKLLLDSLRYAEASQQLGIVTTEQPALAESWLMLGVLQAQDGQAARAEAALQRYLSLSATQAPELRERGQAQAYLSLAQLAEKKGDFSGAESWLARIDNPQLLVSVQGRRASMLARQGKIGEARGLIRALPERTPEEARAKLLAEVQLLRDNKQYRAAYELLGAEVARNPQEFDLLYEQATLAEKQGAYDDMERLLRQIIAAKPSYHNAYNALGYSLADRNVRLPEAKALIQKALEFAPGDPFITDSLGWVEFRAGNKTEALRLLDVAFKTRPDAEIAAHLGEVLWSLDQRDRALAVWREGLLLNGENETLRETLKRLRVKP